MDRAIPVDNASFTPRGSDEQSVLNAFSLGFSQGAKEFREIRARRRAALTVALKKPDIAGYEGFKDQGRCVGIVHRYIDRVLHS